MNEKDIAEALKKHTEAKARYIGDFIRASLQDLSPNADGESIWGNSAKDEYSKARFIKELTHKLNDFPIPSDILNTPFSRGHTETAIRAKLNRFTESVGLSVEEILKQLEKKKEQSASGVATSGWEAFNKITLQKMRDIPPPNLMDAFRELLVNKATDGAKQFEEGDLDMSRIAEYWKGDIFTTVTQEKKKLNVYVFQDISGSMGDSIDEDLVYSSRTKKISALASESKYKIVNEIIHGLFTVIEEAKGLGLPIEFSYIFWGSYLRVIKDIALEEDFDSFQKRLLNLDYQSDGNTVVTDVIHFCEKIESSGPNEKNLIIILTDGDFGRSQNFRDGKDGKKEFFGPAENTWDIIEKHPLPYTTLWFPIGFTPKGSALKYMGDIQTKTRMDIFQVILSKVQEVIDQIYA